MKLTCIGSAGGYPIDGNGTTSYLLTNTLRNYHLLIDAGSGSALAIEKYLPVNEIDAVWLSHDHPDHSADIGIFQHLFFLKKPASTKGQIPVYLNRNSVLWPIMMDDATTKAFPYDIDKDLDLGPFTARFIKTTHPIECAAIRIEEKETGKVLVFTGDSGWQDSLVDFARGADILLADTNFSAERGTNLLHLTSVEAAQLANLAQVKHLVVTHIPPQADRQLILDQVAQAIEANIEWSYAQAGQVWEF